jgi:hypothetical protein
MSNKMIIAVLPVFLGAVAAAPVSAQGATLCPPGVTDATYCAVGNASGVTLERRFTRISGGRSAKMILRCKSSSPCTGRLYLESSSGEKVFGAATYAINGGKRAALRVQFTAATRRTLKRGGRLAATVAVVSNNVRSVIGHVSI